MGYICPYGENLVYTFEGKCQGHAWIFLNPNLHWGIHIRVNKDVIKCMVNKFDCIYNAEGYFKPKY